MIVCLLFCFIVAAISLGRVLLCLAVAWKRRREERASVCASGVSESNEVGGLRGARSIHSCGRTAVAKMLVARERSEFRMEEGRLMSIFSSMPRQCSALQAKEPERQLARR